MRILKNVILDGKPVHFADERLVLELSNSGRGFVTVETTAACVGKLVEFELGTEEDYYTWFTGFVENEHAAQNGYKRLFIRERVAIFERDFYYSARHPTLAEVCKWLSEHSGLNFRYPDKPYATTPIPNFTHSGNGYQMLNNLGRLFNIPDYVWQQDNDGGVFVGSWQDSQWAGFEIELDHRETIGQSATAVQIAIDAEIRPGTVINGKRVHKITLEGENYLLEWQDLNQAGKPKQKSPERRAMEREFPELAGGYHLPKMAKVIGIADPSQAGDVSDPFRPKYAVDVQLLDEDGNEAGSVPIYSAVPLPVTSTASQGGDFAFPEVGTVVELGFVNGRPDQPIVRNFYPQGKTLPNVQQGEMLRQQRPEVFERTDSAGNMHKETDQTISEKSYHRTIKTDSEQKEIGQAVKNVEGNAKTTVGGKKTTHVLGDSECVTAGNTVQGTGGDFTQRVQGVASLIAKGKLEQKGQTVWTGSEGVNGWAILEELLQIVADMGQTLASHTHRGSPPPDQQGQAQSQAQRANNAKARLSPIVA